MGWVLSIADRAMTLAGAVLAFAPPTASAQDTQTRLQLPALSHTTVGFDAARGRLVVYGGLVPGNPELLQGMWEWDGNRWRQVADSASSPPRRDGATMGYDPDTRQLFLFGGWHGQPWSGGAFTPFCDTWTFDSRRWVRRNNGPCVTDRVRNNSLVYDTRRRVMLLFDGTPEIPPAETRRLRIWRWSNNAWVLADSTGPRRNGWEQAVYDEGRGVVVLPVFDGPDAGVWEWDGARWRSTPRTALGPAPRHVYGLAYDARLRRVVMVGGQSYSRPRVYYDDTWTWDGGRWAELPRVGDAAPIARAGAALVSDAVNKRLLYFGGYRAVPPMQDLWELDARGWHLWTAPGTTIALSGPQSLALSVADLEASARWYGELFGLATTMDVRADSNTHVRILSSDRLIVELIADRRAKSVAALAGTEVPSTQVHGIFKAGLFVPDLDSAITALRERSVPIEGQWLQSRPRNLMLRDNSGNLIQLIERR